MFSTTRRAITIAAAIAGLAAVPAVAGASTVHISSGTMQPGYGTSVPVHVDGFADSLSTLEVFVQPGDDDCMPTAWAEKHTDVGMVAIQMFNTSVAAGQFSADDVVFPDGVSSERFCAYVHRGDDTTTDAFDQLELCPPGQQAYGVSCLAPGTQTPPPATTPTPSAPPQQPAVTPVAPQQPAVTPVAPQQPAVTPVAPVVQRTTSFVTSDGVSCRLVRAKLQCRNRIGLGMKMDQAGNTAATILTPSFGVAAGLADGAVWSLGGITCIERGGATLTCRSDATQRGFTARGRRFARA